MVLYICIKYMMSVLSLHCSAGFSVVVESWDYSLVSACGLLITVASLAANHNSRAHGPH